MGPVLPVAAVILRTHRIFRDILKTSSVLSLPGSKILVNEQDLLGKHIFVLTAHTLGCFSERGNTA